MHRTPDQRLHGRCQRRHHQARTDTAGHHPHTEGNRTHSLADQPQADHTEYPGGHRGIAGSQPVRRDGCHHGGKHKTDQRQCTNHTNYIRCQPQIVANRRYKQPEGKSRQPVADRYQRCTQECE